MNHPTHRNQLQIPIVQSQLNQGWTYQDQVNAATQGLTVLEFYTQRYPHSPPETWQDRIDQDQILLDGAPTTADTCLKQGQRLTYDRPPWQEPAVPLTIPIIYEDSDLLVVAKPSGLPVLPGGGFLEHTLLWQLQQHYPQRPPFPIHRLGRGTSGLMLLARSRRARSALSQQLCQGEIRKIYRTLVVGTSLPEQFCVRQPIGKIPYPQLGYLYAATQEGLAAQSTCRVLRRYLDTALVEVEIHTGRPHQIRIHLAAAGYPLVGDPLYGIGGVPLSKPAEETQSRPMPGHCGYHLHAHHLQFKHPTQGHFLSLLCPPLPVLA